MSLVLVHGLRLPVVRVGRFAGQYAKPRSTDTETRDGVTLPSYRGDLSTGPNSPLERARRTRSRCSTATRARRSRSTSCAR